MTATAATGGGTTGRGWQTGGVNTTSFDTTQVSPGLLGFLVVAAIGFALYLLIKSMNKQISKIQVPHEADLEREEKAAKQGAAEKTGGKPGGPDAKK